MGALQGEYLSMVLKKKSIPQNLPFGGHAVMVSDFTKLPSIKLKGGFEITLLSPGEESLSKLKANWKEEIAKLESEKVITDRWAEDSRYEEVAAMYDELGDSTIEKLQTSTAKGDKSIANQSSIAFIGEYESKRCLFAGDATSDNILEAFPALLSACPSERLKLDAWKLAHHGSKGSTLDLLMEKIDCKTIMISSDGKRYHHPDPACLAKLIKHNGPGIAFYFNYLTDYNKSWSNKVWKSRYHFESYYPNHENGISVNL